MGHHGKLRADKTCLNCGHQVEERYCPQCGQENIETRQPFHFLFTHFFEDLTHYDGQFWGTIKNLLFKPGKLTNAYLEGKRQMFVPPVKLYIFVSFVTFLFVAFLPLGFQEHKKDDAEKTKTLMMEINPHEAVSLIQKQVPLKKEDSVKIQSALQTTKDSLIKKTTWKDDLQHWQDKKFGDGMKIMNKKIDNIKQYDSIANKSGSAGYQIMRPIANKAFELKEEGVTYKDFLNGFTMTFMHTLPKALFLYLPFFALLLWIFHSKKKFWYFDHGIFTLHYFSFLLVEIAIILLLNAIARSTPALSFFNSISNILAIIFIIYSGVYFFIAHYKVYRTHPIITVVAGSSLFFINIIAFTALVLLLIVFSFLFMH